MRNKKVQFQLHVSLGLEQTDMDERNFSSRTQTGGKYLYLSQSIMSCDTV